MAIYTRCGAPVQIVEAELRRRWWIHYGSFTKTFDKPPTVAQRKRAKEESEFDIWWIKAKQLGPYPDGSGAAHVGKIMDGPEDLTKRNFQPETLFRADDGIREIHDTCSNVKAYGVEMSDKKRKVLDILNDFVREETQ